MEEEEEEEEEEEGHGRRVTRISTPATSSVLLNGHQWHRPRGSTLVRQQDNQSALIADGTCLGRGDKWKGLGPQQMEKKSKPPATILGHTGTRTQPRFEYGSRTPPAYAACRSQVGRLSMSVRGEQRKGVVTL